MNSDIARTRLAGVPTSVRDSLLVSRGDLPAGAITAVARFFRVLAERGEHFSAPTPGTFAATCANESALGLLLRVLQIHAPEVCLSAGRDLRKDFYRKRPGGSADPGRIASRSTSPKGTRPRDWPAPWLALLPGLLEAPVGQSSIDRHIASINCCADLVAALPIPPRLGWLLAWEIGQRLSAGTGERSPVNARTIATYLGGLVALGLHGGLETDALDGLRAVQKHFVRAGRRLHKQKQGRLDELYEKGGYAEVLRVVVAKLEEADGLRAWTAEAAVARATAAILAVCTNLPARTGDVALWRFGHELMRTVWGTWELRWRQEKTGAWVNLGEVWPEVASVLDEHLLGGRPQRLAGQRFAEVAGLNWLTFEVDPFASRWPSERTKEAIGVPLHDLRTLCADYLRLYDPVRAPGIVATMLGHRTSTAGEAYAALCVETAAQADFRAIRQEHIPAKAGRGMRERRSLR